MWSELRYRLRSLLRRRRLEQELADELEFHLEQQTRKHLRAGHSHPEATRLARVEFGGLDLAREQCREASGVNWVDGVLKDIRYAMRLFRKAPAFALLAVLSLALGTGVNTAVFTVVYSVLLRPLPYFQPDRVVYIGRAANQELAIAEFEFLRQRSSSFSAIAGYRNAGEGELVSPTANRSVRRIGVTGDFLSVLQVRPALGRNFTPEEMQPGRPLVLIITDALWKAAFQGDPGILGKDFRFGEESFTVVGVLPPDFWFHDNADAFLPLRPTGSLSDRGTNTVAIGRLKDSVSLAQAQAECDAAGREFRATVMEKNSDFTGFTLLPLRDWLVGDVRLNLELLFGATGLLVLIACSNLASLLMTRLAGRRPEFAVRMAIGGSSARILRQLFIENFLLAGMGGLVGIFCAYALLRGLLGIIPFTLPATGEIRIDATVLAFTIAVSFATTLLFTIVPFFANTRISCNETLRIGGRSISGGKRHARNALVVTEVALSALLLIAAGLLINSLYRLHQEDLGFEPSGVVSLSAPVPPETREADAAFSAYVEQISQALREAGAQRPAAVNLLPLDGQSNLPTQKYGQPENSIGGMEIRLVTPEYFEVMGIPLRKGRRFAEHDLAGSLPVAIVNEAVLRRWWPDGNLGGQLIIGRFRDQDFKIGDRPREVVGVVGNTKSMNLKDPPRPTVYIPVTQAPRALLGAGRMTWVFRQNPGQSLTPLRNATEKFVPANMAVGFRTMTDLIASNIRKPTFNAWMFGIFAAVAVALAAIGIFGLLSYTVAQRRQEIGMRMALGATRSDVLRLVIRHGLLLIALGLTLGVGAAFFLMRSLTALLYRITASDPISYAAVILLLAAIGLLASYIPARRATRIDPMAALRW